MNIRQKAIAGMPNLKVEFHLVSKCFWYFY